MTFLAQRSPFVRELTFQQILNQKISEMDLRPSDTLRACLIQLRRELVNRHIGYFPAIYFGEDPWGCIDGTSSIEIPFYLANDQLRAIAEKHYITYSNDEIMTILRHEVGHAINYAYKLWRRDDWKQLFGNFKRKYREFYDYDSRSRDFVRCLHHIGNPHYAQKHPDEDFAETFAVWLDPNSKWKRKYRGWNGALAKLEYVDRIFRKERVAAMRPIRTRYDESESYRTFDMTIAEYFQIEKKVNPRIKEYTEDLKEIFSGVSPDSRKYIRADIFIQNYGSYLEEELSVWLAGTDRRDVRKYIKSLQTIAGLNNLRLHPDQATEKLVELVIVATYHVLHRLKRLK
jgi:hypothetical protein